MTDLSLLNHLPIGESLEILLGGAFGALAKDCIEDNTLELPFVQGKKLYLGFIGAAIVGSFIGYVVDQSFFTALMGGYMGKSVLENLLLKGKEIKIERSKEITQAAE